MENRWNHLAQLVLMAVQKTMHRRHLIPRVLHLPKKVVYGSCLLKCYGGGCGGVVICVGGILQIIQHVVQPPVPLASTFPKWGLTHSHRRHSSLHTLILQKSKSGSVMATVSILSCKLLTMKDHCLKCVFYADAQSFIICGVF